MNIYIMVITFPEHPKAPQLGKHEMLAQQTAQHKINLDSSIASLFPMMIILSFDISPICYSIYIYIYFGSTKKWCDRRCC